MLAAQRRPRHTRSGIIALPRADMRTLPARRFRHLCESFEVELGGPLSEVDQNLVRQAAHLVLAAEQQQAAALNGSPIDPDAVSRLSSEMRRVLGMLSDRNRHEVVA